MVYDADGYWWETDYEWPGPFGYLEIPEDAWVWGLTCRVQGRSGADPWEHEGDDDDCYE